MESLYDVVGLVLAAAGFLTMVATIIYDETAGVSHKTLLRIFKGGIVAMWVGFITAVIGNHWGGLSTLVSLITT